MAGSGTALLSFLKKRRSIAWSEACYGFRRGAPPPPLQQSVVQCGICLEDRSADEAESLYLACGHGWHRRCLHKYFEVNICCGDLAKNTCPSCHTIVDSNTVGSLISQETLPKYQMLLFNSQVDSNPDLCWCSTPGCSHVFSSKATVCSCWFHCVDRWLLVERSAGKHILATLTTMGLVHAWQLSTKMQTVALVWGVFILDACDRYMQWAELSHSGCKAECASCQRATCLQCKSAWHFGQRCQSADEHVMQWAVGRDVRRCSKCTCLIERTEGCNHMTCRNCKHEFCWLCGGDYTPGHFSQGPFACTQYGGWNISKSFGSQPAQGPEPPQARAFLSALLALWVAKLLGFGFCGSSSMTSGVNWEMIVVGVVLILLASGSPAASATMRNAVGCKYVPCWLLQLVAGVVMSSAFAAYTVFGLKIHRLLEWLWWANIVIAALTGISIQPSHIHEFAPFQISSRDQKKALIRICFFLLMPLVCALIFLKVVRSMDYLMTSLSMEADEPWSNVSKNLDANLSNALAGLRDSNALASLRNLAVDNSTMVTADMLRIVNASTLTTALAGVEQVAEAMAAGYVAQIKKLEEQQTLRHCFTAVACAVFKGIFSIGVWVLTIAFLAAHSVFSCRMLDLSPTGLFDTPSSGGLFAEQVLTNKNIKLLIARIVFVSMLFSNLSSIETQGRFSLDVAIGAKLFLLWCFGYLLLCFRNNITIAVPTLFALVNTSDIFSVIDAQLYMNFVVMVAGGAAVTVYVFYGSLPSWSIARHRRFRLMMMQASSGASFGALLWMVIPCEMARQGFLCVMAAATPPGLLLVSRSFLRICS